MTVYTCTFNCTCTPEAAHFKSDCLGCVVLVCFVVCMTLLASFFLPSATLINMYVCTCTCIYLPISRHSCLDCRWPAESQRGRRWHTSPRSRDPPENCYTQILLQCVCVRTYVGCYHSLHIHYTCTYSTHTLYMYILYTYTIHVFK